MSKRLRIALAGLLVLVFAGLLWVVLHARERTFRGKPESWWFTNITYRAEAEEVNRWRSYGPEGVQILVRALNEGNAPWQRAWFNIWPKLPPALRNKLPEPANSRSIRMCAANMLDQLHQDAKAAVPALLHNLQVERQDGVRQIVLGYFENPPELSEKEKRQLFPEFVRATQSRDDGVRNNAIVALRPYTNRLEVVMPIMLQALHDPDSGVRLTTAKMLNDIDHQAALKANIVQIVVGCISNSNPRTSSWVPNEAVFFLGRLASDPDISVPPLVYSLHHPDNNLRGNAAYSLGRFGIQAKAAVPALLRALEDPDLYVRKQATNALRAIEPEAIANLIPDP